MTEHITSLPEYVLNVFLLKSHEKQWNGKTWKRGFRALLKLVYLETQLLELVESSMKVPILLELMSQGFPLEFKNSWNTTLRQKYYF